MEYRYQETVDWGIIKREWIAVSGDDVIVIEKHEEDRYTVKITQGLANVQYYSYLNANGKLTWGTLAEAQQFAAQKLAELQAGRD